MTNIIYDNYIKILSECGEYYFKRFLYHTVHEGTIHYYVRYNGCKYWVDFKGDLQKEYKLGPPVLPHK